MHTFFTWFLCLFLALSHVDAATPIGNPSAATFGCDFNLGADVTVCNTATLTLNPNPLPGASFTWIGPGLSCPSCPTPTFGGLSAGVYTVIGIMVSPQCVASDTLVITVQTATLEVNPDTTVCPGAVVNLTAVTSLAGTFLWSNGRTTQAFADTVEQTTTYTVVYSFGNGCTLTDSVVVTVQGLSAVFDFPDEPDLCLGESLQLNSVSTPGATYSWTSLPAGFSSNQAMPIVQPTITTTYVLTTTFGQCTRTETLVVTVFDATLQVSADTTICSGAPLSLMANGGLTGQYQWSTGQTTATIAVAPLATTVYNVTFTYGNGQCMATESVQVGVLPGIEVWIDPDPDTLAINPGDAVELTAIVAPSQNLSGFNFMWSDGIQSVGSTETINVTAPSSPSDTLRYTLKATAPNGCMADTIIVFRLLHADPEFPTAFTPNGDALNDRFRMVLREGRATVDRMEIYNRWGQLVFTSAEPAASWDGRIDSLEAPTDVYVYKVWWRNSIGALQPLEMGEVTLLR